MSTAPDTKPSDFQIGWDAALKELADGQMELVAGFASFKNDMPDSEWMWGYFAALYEKLEEKDG